MCDRCRDIALKDSFLNPTDYLTCLIYIEGLVTSELFGLVSGTCDLNMVKKNGVWVDDIIAHVIQCNSCGKFFTCSVDTYHGKGSFREGK